MFGGNYFQQFECIVFNLWMGREILGVLYQGLVFKEDIFHISYAYIFNNHMKILFK